MKKAALNRHIIFDFDGTLIDSGAAILETLQGVLERNRIPLARPMSQDVIGPPLRVTLQALTGIGEPEVLDTLAVPVSGYQQAAASDQAAAAAFRLGGLLRIGLLRG